MVVMQHAIYRALDCFDLPTHWATIPNNTTVYSCMEAIYVSNIPCLLTVGTVVRGHLIPNNSSLYCGFLISPLAVAMYM